LKTLINWNPAGEMRSMDEALDRLLFGPKAVNSDAILPIDVFEQEGKFIVRAAVPGVTPEDLSVQVEKNILSISGEQKPFTTAEDTKVYRREVNYGTFSRSLRLPENLNLEAVDAEFKNGIVTISIPKVEEPKPLPIKINVRS
jgi:HSP20 family protein